MNDNPPRFEVPDYQAHGIPEDVPIGTSILQGKLVMLKFCMKYFSSVNNFSEICFLYALFFVIINC